VLVEASPWRRRIALLLALGLLAAGYGSWRRTAAWIEGDPQFCGQCHVTQDQYLLWEQDAHRKVACQACHRQTLQQAGDMLRAYVGGQGAGRLGRPDPLHTSKVPMNTCTGCHGHAQAGRKHIAGSAGHDVHLNSPKVTCKSCHGKTIHRSAEPMEACGDCHQEAVRITGMARLHCTACHDFRARKDDLLPARAVCVDCHASRGVEVRDYSQDRHMSNLACSVCHRPHQQGPEAIQACTGCHAHRERHGLHASSGHQGCTDCHAPHTWEVSPAACKTCHATAPAHGDDGPCWRCHDARGRSP
jgi:hypothetical protein